MINFWLHQSRRYVLIFTFTAAILGVFGVWYWQSATTSLIPPTPPITTLPPVEEKPIVTPTDDPKWSLYTNQKYHFSLQFPTGWTVKEEKISEIGGPEDVARDIIKMFNPEVGGFTILIIETDKDIMTWAKENRSLVTLTTGRALPEKTNAVIAGVPALVSYSESKQAHPSTGALLKREKFLYQLTLGTGRVLQLDLFEYSIRSFEFDNLTTEDILPKFPLEP